jgi:hypothetical protein
MRDKAIKILRGGDHAARGVSPAVFLGHHNERGIKNCSAQPPLLSVCSIPDLQALDILQKETAHLSTSQSRCLVITIKMQPQHGAEAGLNICSFRR